MKDDKLHVARMEALCTPQYMYNFLVPICAMDNSGCHILPLTEHSFGAKINSSCLKVIKKLQGVM
jgi:hypothetical protein